MLRTTVAGVEICSKLIGGKPLIGLILRGISREQVQEMLDKYAMVIIRRPR